MVKDFGAIPEDTNFGIKSSVLKDFLKSNDVKLKKPNKKDIDKKELSQLVQKGTLFISCWMTEAKIREYKTQKVMFESLK